MVSALLLALLAGTSLALPSSSPHTKSGIARRQARRTGQRSSQAPAWISQATSSVSGGTKGHDAMPHGGGWGSWGSGSSSSSSGSGKGKGNSTGVTQTEYTQNWAGAVFTSGSFSSVSGTISVPTPSAPSGGDSSTAYTASAWVGIDGATCGTGAILQTGIDFTTQYGEVSYLAWYEWLPADAFDWTSGISFSAGDTVTMSVSASSSTTGSASITNESTGESVSVDLSSGTELCEVNAEWIVEDYQIDGEFAPFAAFSPVTFWGTSPSASGAMTVDIEQGSVLTSSSIDSDGSVTVNYVG